MILMKTKIVNNLVNEVGKDYISFKRPQDNVGRPINRNYFDESLPVVNVHLREGHIMDYTTTKRKRDSRL